jgi:hypothetical protein
MSDLVFISFPTEEKAEGVRQKVLELQKEYLIELEDAVVVVKTPDGKIKLLTGGDRFGVQLGVAFHSRAALPRSAHAGDHARFASGLATSPATARESLSPPEIRRPAPKSSSTVAR